LSKLTLTCQCVTSKEISAAFHKAEAMLCNLGRGSADLSNSSNTILEELRTTLAAANVAYEQLLQVQQEVLLEKHEQVLQERQRYYNFFHFAPAGAFVTDTRGVIQNVNQALEELLNMTSEHLVSKPFVTFLPLEKRSEFWLRLADLQSQELAQIWDTTLKLRSVNVLPVSICAKRCLPPYADELWWWLSDRRDRIAAETAMQLAQARLEQEVDERTAALTAMNERLKAEIRARKKAEHALQLQAKQEQMLHTIAHRIRSSLDLQQVLQATVTEVRDLLKVDRVLILQFQPNGTKRVVTEARHKSYQALLSQAYHEPCFDGQMMNYYRQGNLRAFRDIQAADTGLHPCLVETLLKMDVRALLLVPILQNEQLWGLLIAHHCCAPRPWQDHEQTLLSRLATQVGIAIQQSALYAETQRLSRFDSLTQIANRRWFDAQLTILWKQHQRDQTPLALALADVDYFKAYNDSYGHPAGDRCLRTLAELLNRSIQRPNDLVARYGGEEFALILPNTDLAGARHIADTILEDLQRLRLPHRESPLKIITMSFGVISLIPSIDQSVETFIQRVDDALYEAKARGRNQVVVWPGVGEQRFTQES